MQTVFEQNNRGPYARIICEQYANGKFRVTYGMQVKTNLSYAEAAEELGACLLHDAGCQGLLVGEE